MLAYFFANTSCSLQETILNAGNALNWDCWPLHTMDSQLTPRMFTRRNDSRQYGEDNFKMSTSYVHKSIPALKCWHTKV